MEYIRRQVRLYPAEGQVLPIQAFIENNLHLLSEHEQGIVRDQLALFPAEQGIPGLLRVPLARSKWIGSGGRAISALRGGGRSAYLPEEQVYLKGCKPAQEAREYFNLVWNFDAQKLETRGEPQGVLSAEDVMRELLAHAFLRRHGLPALQAPLCVFAYLWQGQARGFCLAMRSGEDLRLENRADVENIPFSEQNRQAGFAGVDFGWYARRKARILAEMHFAGGFRNYTNCNFGNEVVAAGTGGGDELYLLDYDKFFVLDVPRQPDTDFIHRFYTCAFIELLESATPLVLLPPQGAGEEERAATARALLGAHLELGLYVAVREQGAEGRAGLVKAREITRADQAAVSRLLLRKWSPLYCAFEGEFVERAARLGWPAAELERAAALALENGDFQNKLLVSVLDTREQAARRMLRYRGRHN